MNAATTAAFWLAPVRDHAGRFAPLKLVALIGLCLPALWLLWQAQSGALGARPIDGALDFTGRWALRLFWLALLVSPAHTLFRWPRVLLLRRMMGVAGFAYLALHFSLYAVDQKLDVARIATEIALRIYLTIGFVALLGYAALTITSTEGWQRRLGRRWGALHRLVHPLALLGLTHFAMQSKLDVAEAALMLGLLLWLWAVRLLGRRAGPGWLLVLALVTAAATALGEAAWHGLMTGVDPQRVLRANLLFFNGVLRPCWWVLLAGLVAALFAFLRQQRTKA